MKKGTWKEISVVGVWVLLTASEKPDPTGQRMTSWEPDISGINSTDYTEQYYYEDCAFNQYMVFAEAMAHAYGIHVYVRENLAIKTT